MPRPSLESGTTRPISCRIPKSTLERVDARAKGDRSAWLRRAIDLALDMEEPRADEPGALAAGAQTTNQKEGTQG